MKTMLDILNEIQNNWNNYSEEKQEKIANEFASAGVSADQFVDILNEK